MAFPGTELLLSVDTSILPIVAGESFGLVYRHRDGQLATVGSLATATEQKNVDADDDCSLLSCTIASRINILDVNQTATPMYATTFEVHDDAPVAKPDEAQQLCDDMSRRLGELRQLESQTSERSSSPEVMQQGASSAADFSLALAGILEHDDLRDAQALLESTDTMARLAKLDQSLLEAVQFTSTQAMLQRLGMG